MVGDQEEIPVEWIIPQLNYLLRINLLHSIVYSSDQETHAIDKCHNDVSLSLALIYLLKFFQRLPLQVGREHEQKESEVVHHGHAPLLTK